MGSRLHFYLLPVLIIVEPKTQGLRRSSTNLTFVFLVEQVSSISSGYEDSDDCQDQHGCGHTMRRVLAVTHDDGDEYQGGDREAYHADQEETAQTMRRLASATLTHESGEGDARHGDAHNEYSPHCILCSDGTVFGFGRLSQGIYRE